MNVIIIQNTCMDFGLLCIIQNTCMDFGLLKTLVLYL